MMTEASPLELNARDLEQELAWFTALLDTRVNLYFKPDKAKPDGLPSPPDLSESASSYAGFLRYYNCTYAERTAVVLALTPHIRPRLLDIFYLKNSTFDRKFTEFGGIFGGADGDFTPTFDTLAFVLGGEDLAMRFTLQALFDPTHYFSAHGVLTLSARGDDPPLKAPLRLSPEYLSFFTTGRPHRPDFGENFPARYIDTQLTWDDLVLHPGTRRQIEEIETWLTHGQTLMTDWGMAPKLRPGYRSLFYGPPGTGKTLTACLLGKSTGRDVYKVDLSLVVSKYIGETEKNLSRVFDQAQHKDWILFFDEADALFGKRSDTKDAHDRYANQEVSYLLQRIETFDGIAVLCSNRRENMDEAFARRFESVIYFPIPRPEERLRLWSRGFSKQAQLEDSLNLEQLSHDHQLAGGAIMNVIRYASLEALRKESRLITGEDVRNGIRREYAKEGKGV